MVRVFESELAQVIGETDAHRSIETGGSLFGLWTDGGNLTVFLAIGPGPRAVRAATHFEQDPATHRAVEESLVERFGVQAVGLWHSHHHLGLTELSGGDLNRTLRFARRTGRTRFCDLLTYFGPSGRDRDGPVVVKPYLHLDAAAGRRAATGIVVLPGVSPVREALLADDPPFVGPLSVQGAGEHVRFELATSPDADGPPTRISARALAVLTGRGRAARDQPRLTENPEDAGRSDFAIADLTEYVTEHVQPALRTASAAVRCEIQPTADGMLLQLTLAARGEQHVLELGWAGGPVVVSHRFRAGPDVAPRELVTPAERAAGVEVASRVGHVLATLQPPVRRGR
ncbi:hypothetical protein Acsp05_44110 [Actinokineospora sp. NBRC 105648]|nr:hypothetical protein Acsp05_44110 [Actinokineospora sp. NBRC 105648]